MVSWISAFFQIKREAVGDLRDQFAEVEHDGSGVFGAQAGELEQVADEFGLVLGVGADAFEFFDGVVGEVVLVFHEQHLRHARDVAHRGVEVVADGAEELVLILGFGFEFVIDLTDLGGALFNNLLEMAVALGQLLLGGVERADHGVEGGAELAEVVVGGGVDRRGHLAVGQLVDGLSKRLKRGGPLGDGDGDHRHDDQADQHRQPHLPQAQLHQRALRMAVVHDQCEVALGDEVSIGCAGAADGCPVEREVSRVRFGALVVPIKAGSTSVSAAQALASPTGR